jgi:hypothetical protein
LTGFKRFPGFRDLALKPYHEGLESPDSALVSLCRVFPDGKTTRIERLKDDSQSKGIPDQNTDNAQAFGSSAFSPQSSR